MYITMLNLIPPGSSTAARRLRTVRDRFREIAR